MARVRDHRPILLFSMAWLAALPVVFLHGPGSEKVTVAPALHFFAVAAAATIAGAAAVALTIAGVRKRDGRTVLLGTAFSTMTAPARWSTASPRPACSSGSTA